jgi:4-amino-4-deoxy-L-arabinose transferase-like glycosyltransferase
LKDSDLQKRGIWIAALILLIAGFGLYLRIVMVHDTAVDGPLRADASEYYLSAYNLTKNGVYTISDARLRNPGAVLQPDNFRWPGQPLLIAAFMADWPDHLAIVGKIQWVNIIAGTATLVLIGAAAATVFPAWAAISVVLLAALSPHLIALTVYALTETPGAFFVALLLGLCALGRSDDASRGPAVMIMIGIVIGLLALFRPIFIGFVPLIALAVTRNRLKCLVLVAVGAAVPVAPWLIRNMLADDLVTTPSSLAMTLVIGAYPDYTFNGNPRTFPFPQSYDPDFLKVSASVTTAAEEVLRRITADPLGMIAWYGLRKPVYLWQFVNIDGVGDVFVYPVRTSPFTSDPVFAFAHEAMRVMHWPIVVLAAIGSILVWLPRVSGLLPESRGLVLRTGSLLLMFLAVATIPLNNPARFAVPVLPALFLMAMVLPVVLARWIGRKSRQSKPTSTGRQKPP